MGLHSEEGIARGVEQIPLVTRYWVRVQATMLLFYKQAPPPREKGRSLAALLLSDGEP